MNPSEGDIMAFEQIAEIVRNGQIMVLFCFLWWLERADRKTAEKRERAVLRDVADLPMPENED